MEEKHGKLRNYIQRDLHNDISPGDTDTHSLDGDNSTGNYKFYLMFIGLIA